MKTITENHKKLIGEYFGYVNKVQDTESGELVEIHIAYPSEDWECAEWYLDGEKIANCDGYSGVEWEVGFNPDEEIEELVEPYGFTGLLNKAKAAIREEAEEL